MKNIFKILLTILLLINSSYTLSQNLYQEEKEILEMQDKRIVDEKLIQYLHSINPDIRARAIYALANIADSNSVSELNFLLAGPFKDYPSKSDLISAAFMLGQIQSYESKNILELMLKNNRDSTIAMSHLINSLGKIGIESDLDNVTQFYMTNYISDDELTQAIAISIARFALRKIKNEKAIDALKIMSDVSSDTLTQRNIAFAFWRIGDKNLLENARQQIYNLTKSDDAQTRMWAYNAIGKLQNQLLLIHTLESFNSEKDWRVKVNMLNSFTNFELDSLTETIQLLSILGDAVGDENEHISLTAINVLGKLFGDLKNSNNNVAKSQTEKLRSEFLHGLDSADNLSWRIKSELANSMSLIFKDEVKNDLFKAFSNTNDYNLKGGIVRAFGNFNDGMVYKEVRDTISAEVKRYNEKNPNITGDLIGSNDLAKLYRGFVDMLSTLDEKLDDENINMTRLIFTEFAGSKDPLIVDISLTALKDSLYLKYRGETNSVLLFDYNELQYPKDNTVNLIFIDAMKDLYNDGTIKVLENNLKSENFEIANSSADVLEKITGKKYEYISGQKTDYDWNYIESMSQRRNVIVKTNKGNIKIELFPDVAPFTVMNFLKLSDKNFYDGTIFHRVVSNFVIQGGDPTGTGYGSPGYTIRSEFSPLTYERGMVGMASSGKDTEGSQFFITHSATPHLDGKYTIFGKVVEGSDVVDKIMIGDEIEDVVVE